VDAYKHLGVLTGAEPMWILIIYVLIVVVGEAVVVAIGLALDRIFPLASFTSFFVVILRRARVWMAAGSALD